mgnify:CR=1 FL=1
MNVILHLGLGSFHRAHQAVYLQALRDPIAHIDYEVSQIEVEA